MTQNVAELCVEYTESLKIQLRKRIKINRIIHGYSNAIQYRDHTLLSIYKKTKVSYIGEVAVKLTLIRILFEIFSKAFNLCFQLRNLKQ